MRSHTRPCRSGSSLLCTLLFLMLLCGKAEAGENRFYEDSKHGWFWYQDPPLQQEEEKQAIKQEPTESRISSSLNAYSIEDLWNMYPDDFQELLNVLQKKAVQAPTEQHIVEYLTMQDIARRKALAYTNATMYVTQKYGERFNVNHVYPTTGPGITARVRMQQDEIIQTLNQAGNDHALLFFISPGCGFCDQQAAILSYFLEKYHWQIKMVDISRNISSAARFNITITPTLLLIKKGEEEYMTVANGVIALNELERKLYRAVRTLQGTTREDTFLMYDFQKDTVFDPTSILDKEKQPWKKPD